ncbi:hypothetical protein PIB30_098504 [Stylosanthes scabra]|uniref:Uncharacterized protein n=1 Tax=Stylosanthes scabra TaxID=79078 RepID=A0ABU6VYA3_9FABA|nr:hypothetical protein [Stylosanthes scabra]
MASSSTYHYDQYLFRAPHHQEIYQKYIHKKGVTPEKSFDLQEVRTEEELAIGEDYPYTSFVRRTEVDFSAAKIREVLRIRHMTLGAETDFKTRQYEDQRLDEVIRDICMPGAQWKMSSSHPLTQSN